MVIDRRRQFLARAQVALGGLDRGMAEQELDLLQGAAGDATQPGAGSPEMMRGERGLSALRAILAGDRPDGIYRNALSPHRTSLVDGTDQATFGDPGLGGPVIHGGLDPG